MSKTPLIAAVLHSNEKDKDYQLYCAAYGLEMQIDDQWKVELALFAPHDHLHAVTKNTGVTSEDTAIASAGVTDIPIKDGKPDLSKITDEKNNWLLLGQPERTDPLDVLKSKLHAALEAECRPILCFSDIGTNQLASRLAGINPQSLSRLVIAYVGPDAGSKSVKKAITHLEATLGHRLEDPNSPRFIMGGKTDGAKASKLVTTPGVSGILLTDDDYSHFGDLLEILEAVGGADEN